jgi:hypothetical protein
MPTSVKITNMGGVHPQATIHIRVQGGGKPENVSIFEGEEKIIMMDGTNTVTVTGGGGEGAIEP